MESFDSSLKSHEFLQIICIEIEKLFLKLIEFFATESVFLFWIFFPFKFELILIQFEEIFQRTDQFFSFTSMLFWALQEIKKYYSIDFVCFHSIDSLNWLIFSLMLIELSVVSIIILRFSILLIFLSVQRIKSLQFCLPSNILK